MNKIVAISVIPGTIFRQYEKSVDEFKNLHSTEFEGHMYRSTCKNEEGNMVVVDIWKSKEQLKKFTEILHNALEKKGVNPIPQKIITLQDFDLHDANV